MKQETAVQRPAERYAPPSVKVITTKAAQVLCGSERQSVINSSEMNEGDDNW